MATSQPRRIVFQLGDQIRISPPMWDNNTADGYPGDFSSNLPQGTGVYGYQVPEAGTRSRQLRYMRPVVGWSTSATTFPKQISKPS